MRFWWTAWLALCALGCDAAPTTPIVIERDDLRVEFRPADGTFDLLRGGTLVFQDATADVLVSDPEGRRLVSFTDACTRSLDSDGAIVCTTSGLELRLSFDLPAGKRYATAVLKVVNRGSAPITVERIAPVVIDSQRGGGLFLGMDPAAHRILENGRFIAFDQTVQLEAGDVAPFGLANISPIPLRGNSVANWNQIVADVAHPEQSLVAGYLTFEHCIPTLGVGFDSTIATKPDALGRTPFTTWAAESALVFHGKSLAPGADLSSELLYLDPLPADPLEALENYASAVADHQGITPWPKRGAGHEVPNGWCSWTGGDSTGGYGQTIDASLIAANLDVMNRQLKPFGVSYFQIDDGWENDKGDWQWKAMQFPNGAAGEVAAIGADGFRPGLWIGPYSVDGNSMLAQQHPDWIDPPETGLIGMLAGSGSTLDLSNPDVLDWLTTLFGRLKNEGWKWLKVDFTYNDLLGRPQHDPSLTNIEAWRGGWRAIREAIGDDVFLLGIAIMGSNIGVLDGMRLTLDNGPKWDEDDPNDYLMSPRAFKGTVRTGARRWFYQNRIWVNHDDLIYFRSWPDQTVPALTLAESRTFATWIGLGGGVVKIGDKLVDMDMHPEWIDVLRRILPAWPDGARPLDVLQRDYPEVYRETIVAPAGQWDMVGLCNWGSNRDLTTTPPTVLGETARDYPIDCAGECLAYEFWSETFLGKMSGSFTVSVGARDTKVLALRTPTGAPQLLGSNRHITQGATDLGPIAWDASQKTLSGTLAGAVGTATAPWEYHLAFYAPAGFTVDHAEVDGVAAPVVSQTNEVVKLQFSLPDTAQGTMVGYKVVFQ